MILLFGLAGSALGYLLSLPSGVFLGAMMGVGGGVLSLGSPPVSPPPEIAQLVQILVGLTVGLMVSRHSLLSNASAVIPGTVLAVGMIATGAVTALIVVNFTSVDPATAFFAAVPGGVALMAIVADSLGADGASVAVIHLARVLVVLAIASALLAKYKRDDGKPREARLAAAESILTVPTSRGQTENAAKWLWLAVFSGTGAGAVGLATSVPGGGVIGAFIGSASVRLWKVCPAPPAEFKIGVQALSGGVTGLGISAEFFGRLAQLIGVAALTIPAQLVLWLIAGHLLVRCCRQDRATAVFASAPASIGQLTATPNQTQLNTTTVALIHLMKVSAIILFAPALGVLFVGG